MNPMGQQESPTSASLRPLGSIRQIFVSEGWGFRTRKVILDLIIPGGPLRVTLDRPINYTLV